MIECKLGTRVELHPATDAWMMGDRYGAVERVGRKYLYVRMDRSGKLRKLAPRNIYAWSPDAIRPDEIRIAKSGASTDPFYGEAVCARCGLTRSEHHRFDAD